MGCWLKRPVSNGKGVKHSSEATRIRCFLLTSKPMNIAWITRHQRSVCTLPYFRILPARAMVPKMESTHISKQDPRYKQVLQRQETKRGSLDRVNFGSLDVWRAIALNGMGKKCMEENHISLTKGLVLSTLSMHS